MPKIATGELGLFLVKRSSDRDVLSALVTLGTPRHDRMIAPIKFNALFTTTRSCAPPHVRISVTPGLSTRCAPEHSFRPLW
jgi:hypothetical protein